VEVPIYIYIYDLDCTLRRILQYLLNFETRMERIGPVCRNLANEEIRDTGGSKYADPVSASVLHLIAPIV
jgi:hypothetical protein